MLKDNSNHHSNKLQIPQPPPASIQLPQRVSRDYQDLKTPQLPQNALSRDRNRKGSISTPYKRGSVDGSALGISNSTPALNNLNGGRTSNDYYSSGKQEFQIVNGIVRPSYSHVSSKSVSSTLGPLPTPPAAATTNSGILQQEYVTSSSSSNHTTTNSHSHPIINATLCRRYQPWVMDHSPTAHITIDPTSHKRRTPHCTTKLQFPAINPTSHRNLRYTLNNNTFSDP